MVLVTLKVEGVGFKGLKGWVEEIRGAKIDFNLKECGK